MMAKVSENISQLSKARSPLSLAVRLRRVQTIVWVLAVFAYLCFAPGEANALTPKEQYYKAKDRYAHLLKNAAHQKRRDKWLACIDSFEKVYRMDPNGPWAAAGMFKSAELYYELYRRSGRKAYRNEALDRFERITKRYPDSRYRPKSEAKITAIGTDKKTATVKKTTSLQGTRYGKAEACYNKLMDSPKKQRYRDQWMACIETFDAAFRADSEGAYADACLYYIGELYRGLHRWSHLRADSQKAVEHFQNTIRWYPQSVYAGKAESRLKSLHAESGGSQTAPNAGRSDAIAAMIDDGAADLKTPVAASPANDGRVTVVEGLRSWSNPGYTRIVIDADRETSFNHHVLKPDPSLKKPPRLYVDLMNSVLKKGFETSVPINDHLLSRVRAGQYRPDAVRVVIDIKSYKYYKIFKLSNPFRIVVDVRGEDTPTGGDEGKAVVRESGGGKIGPGELARQLSLGVKRIVIDPGHGGKDYGAPGYYKGVHEKYIVLSIAKKLKKKIERELNCEVFLTRNTDRYLTLEERTAIANTKNADLFISIHTNSARDRRAHGIETYFLNLATDDESIRVAAYENQTSTKNISDLETILNDLMQNAKIHESSRLASNVQSSLNAHMRKSYKRINNKGVKQAPFYVLLGAQMPAILVETSFISNARECKRLTTDQYQDHLCDAIIKGIRKYIEDINPTARYWQDARTGSSG
ncbi:MAG: N-acetylmuramoyl-L-alanine amidase [Deltaproteobacteria bacterium]|nr:N-acetylmuramoyl-L-alanine amidase [Deltaproteobacteria bacterium]